MESPLTIRWRSHRLSTAGARSAWRLLTVAERARAEAAPEARRDAFLAGRLLLREVVAEAGALDAASVVISAACPDCGLEHGGPLIEGSDLAVSLSHTADAAVAVAVRGARVGIDVERTSTSVADLAALIREPTLQRWTRIEAVLKADGRGLRVDPGAVAFSSSPRGEIAVVEGSLRRYLVREVEVPGMPRSPSLTASVAVEIV